MASFGSSASAFLYSVIAVGEVVVEEVQVAEVHVRAGGIVQLHRAAVVHAGLLLVAFLQIEVADQQLQHGVVGNDVDQLLHAAQRVRAGSSARRWRSPT